MAEVKLLAGTIGAEIRGIDLTQFITESIGNEIRSLLLEHQVIFFRDQDLQPAQHKALAELFGPLDFHPAYPSVEGFPEIMILESTPEVPSKIDTWHSDMTFRQHPPVGTVLRSRITPPKGGDTLFSSMTAAYEGLSEVMQEFLDALTAVHDFRYGFRESLAEPGGEERLKQALLDNPPVEHPVIQAHPETGKKVIFVNELFTKNIVGLELNESDAILSFLFKHVTTDEYTYRFSWEPNSIAIWDNRSTQHKPVNDFFPGHRKLERSVILGDHPY
ncbi:MAG: TauD/TfdA family dioxygenase [Candidatus Hydrogenedentota bacterium]